MRQQVDQLRTDLTSDKVTKRKVVRDPEHACLCWVADPFLLAATLHSPMKDGYKLLTSLIDNAAFKAFVDAETARIKPCAKIRGEPVS